MMPRIRKIQACDDYVLHVTFENGVTKLYDIKPRLNDDVDLSENALWAEGKDSN